MKFLRELLGLLSLVVKRVALWRNSRRERKRRQKEAEYREKLKGLLK